VAPPPSGRFHKLQKSSLWCRPDADVSTHHRPRTDDGSFRPPPHIFRGSFLFFRHSHFDQLTDSTGLTGRLSEGVSPCRISTAVVQRHVGLGQIERESEAHASFRGHTSGVEARTVGPVVFRGRCYQIDGSRPVSIGLPNLPGPPLVCLLHFARVPVHSSLFRRNRHPHNFHIELFVTPQTLDLTMPTLDSVPDHPNTPGWDGTSRQPGTKGQS
jgi:hypothetical protein